MASSYNWDTRGHLKIRVRSCFQNAQAHFLTRVLGTLVRRPISLSPSPRHTSLHWLLPHFVFMYREDQPVCIPLSRCVVNVVSSSCSWPMWPRAAELPRPGGSLSSEKCQHGDRAEKEHSLLSRLWVWHPRAPLNNHRQRMLCASWGLPSGGWSHQPVETL